MSLAAPADARASIAVDLGAESCRVTLLRWTHGAPNIALVHRFANAPVLSGNALRWPLQSIIAGVEDGMRRCAELAPEGIRSVAVDGWAVDYVRLGADGKPLAEPFCYRDERTVDAERRLHERITAERMREITGIQQFRINTLYQLYADRLSGYDPGTRWLNLPEYLLHHWGGRAVSEYTNATHTQLVDLHTREWSPEIFAAAGLDLAKAPMLVPPGTCVGRLSGPLAELPAFRATGLIAPACHDTASALAGIPAEGEDWAYISSGTWSLVGTRLDHPVSNAAVRQDNFTNLGGVGKTTCFHRNVNGMWLVKQCMDAWAEAGGAWTLDELLSQAALLEPHTLPLEEWLDVDDPELLLLGEMPARINRQRALRGLAGLDGSPSHAPAMMALLLASLSARYAEVLSQAAEHTGKHFTCVYVVGGGSRNTLLNALTERSTGLRVCRGPVESSTIGNLAVQLATLEGNTACASREFAAEVARWASLLHTPSG